MLQHRTAGAGAEALGRSLQRALQVNPAAEVQGRWSWTREDLATLYRGRGVKEDLDTWSLSDLVLGLVAECCRVTLRTLVTRRDEGCALPGLEHRCQVEVLDDVFVAWHEGRLGSQRGDLCPACGLDEVVPVVWGMPDANAYRTHRAEVISAGCALPSDPWTHQCRRCGAHWGSWLAGREYEAVGSPFDGLDDED